MLVVGLAVAAGASALITLVVKATATGGTTLSNTASVSAASTDPHGAYNVATLTARVFGSRH